MEEQEHQIKELKNAMNNFIAYFKKTERIYTVEQKFNIHGVNFCVHGEYFKHYIAVYFTYNSVEKSKIQVFIPQFSEDKTMLNKTFTISEFLQFLKENWES